MRVLGDEPRGPDAAGRLEVVSDFVGRASLSFSLERR